MFVFYTNICHVTSLVFPIHLSLTQHIEQTQPSKLNVVAYAKYGAWGKFKGLPEQFAMKKYCEVVYHFSKGGESSYGVGERDDNNVDVIYDDDKQQRDVDEDGCPVNISGKRDWDDLGVITGMGMRPSTLSGILEAKSQTSESKATTAEVRLRDAAIANDVASLKDVIKGECDIDDTDEAGLGALHLAADRGKEKCTSFAHFTLFGAIYLGHLT